MISIHSVIQYFSTRSRAGTNARLLSITVISVILVAGVLCVLGYQNSVRSARPIFYSEGRGGSGHWVINSPIADQNGGYAFYDLELNLLVIVEAKPNIPVRDLIASASRDSARLLPDTQFEFTANRCHNKMILRRQNGQIRTFELAPDDLRGWLGGSEFRDLLHRADSGGLFEIALRLARAQEIP